MKVLHVLDTGDFSGAENVAITIISYLEKHDMAQCVYLSPKGPIEDYLAEKNIDFYGVDKLNFSSLKKALAIVKPDVIHVHSFKSAVILALLNPKGKFVIHIHDNPEWLKHVNAKSILFLKACKRADRILTVSDAIEYEFFYSDKVFEKIENIGNPINDGKIIRLSNKPIFFERKNKNQLNHGALSSGGKRYNPKYDFDMIYVGRIEEEKNPFLLAKIINELCDMNPSIRIGIVGDGKLRDKFFSKIEEYYRENNITYFGCLENPYPIIKRSKSLVLPSLSEGYATVVAEALILGVPVVCSGVGTMLDVIDDKCGKICSFSDKAYVAEISRLTTDEIYHHRKVKATLERGRRLGNIREYYRKIRKLYNEMVDQGDFILSRYQNRLWFLKSFQNITWYSKKYYIDVIFKS